MHKIKELVMGEGRTEHRQSYPKQCLNQRAVSLPLSLSLLCVHFKINFLNWVPYPLESLMLESYFG